MRMSFLAYCLLVSLAFSLGSCSRSSPTNYYLLESATGPMRVDGLPARTLRVAQVEVPGYLNRNNIVSRVQGETKIILAEFHLWAEPVSNGVRRVIGETLTRPMLENKIAVLPDGTDNGGDYTLLIDVQRLDGNFNEKAVLESHWTLLDRNERRLEGGIYSAEEVVAGADYNLLVGAESKLVREFGQYLAQRLPGIIRNKRNLD